MKKPLVICLSVFGVLFLFGSCASSVPITYDEALGDSDVAIINYVGIDIVEYNGITVDWSSPGSGQGCRLLLKIPGGTTKFIINGTTGSANMGYTTYRNILFTYDFSNGREYTVFLSGAFIKIYNGKSFSNKELIDTFNMRDGQTLVEKK